MRKFDDLWRILKYVAYIGRRIVTYTRALVQLNILLLYSFYSDMTFIEEILYLTVKLSVHMNILSASHEK